MLMFMCITPGHVLVCMIVQTAREMMDLPSSRATPATERTTPKFKEARPFGAPAKEARPFGAQANG